MDFARRRVCHPWGYLVWFSSCDQIISNWDMQPTLLGPETWLHLENRSGIQKFSLPFLARQDATPAPLLSCPDGAKFEVWLVVRFWRSQNWLHHGLEHHQVGHSFERRNKDFHWIGLWADSVFKAPCPSVVILGSFLQSNRQSLLPTYWVLISLRVPCRLSYFTKTTYLITGILNNCYHWFLSLE